MGREGSVFTPFFIIENRNALFLLEISKMMHIKFSDEPN